VRNIVDLMYCLVEKKDERNRREKLNDFMN